MTRTQYKNNHIKEHYDRINLCIKGAESQNKSRCRQYASKC